MMFILLQRTTTSPPVSGLPRCGSGRSACAKSIACSRIATARNIFKATSIPRLAAVWAVLAWQAAGLYAQQPELGQLDASPTLFTVMAAVNAAGYDAQIESTNNHPLRQAVRDELAKKTIPSLAALKAFYAKHTAIEPYISFALVCDGPPTFIVHKKDIEVPPEVVPYEKLSPLLAAFYKEAGIADLWARSQNAINQYIARYHAPVTDAVFNVNVYLRQQTSGLSRARFQILLELLGAPNQLQVRSYGLVYTVVLTPSPDLRIFDIRHAYLRYIIDGLCTHYADVLERKKGIADHALRAQALNDAYKQDFLQLASESMVRAVEARLDHTPQSVQQSFHQGFILTPYFSEQLAVYEHQELAMSAFFKDMVQQIDVVREEERLAPATFDSKAAPAKTVHAAPPPPPPLTGVDKTLKDAQDLYDEHNYPVSKKLFLQVLQETESKDMHAEAYYGLAHIAALEKDPDTAERFFLRTLELDPQKPQTRAYTLIYLGKLAAARGDSEQAVKYLQDALQVKGAPDKVLAEAQRALTQIQTK